ncbi:hypothetical protein PAXRUDRAFT_826692 [Paxillus rubicundulus Ve08.2h10]|uniref:Uncharacterized protein n=1 Tax=Paxillus rubicundulus Ve08.2h10 TaxID=930991 RepID=A0A0D0DRM5_9AGAM|nr:hypothetical protein PAXRUDRAFT_826692 [Paxillus rubicundulus Ve08.2h10]
MPTIVTREATFLMSHLPKFASLERSQLIRQILAMLVENLYHATLISGIEGIS